MSILATIQTSNLFIYLGIGLVVAFVAYRSSETYKRQHNVTPWHLPSLVWALIGFLSLLLCAILFLIAAEDDQAGGCDVQAGRNSVARLVSRSNGATRTPFLGRCALDRSGRGRRSRTRRGVLIRHTTHCKHRIGRG